MFTKIKSLFHHIFIGQSPMKRCYKEYLARFEKYSFEDLKCKDEFQFEASITRLYHTIEKGLAYEDYRPGFGKGNVEALIESLEQYSKQYGCTTFFYETALSCLDKYINTNASYGCFDKDIEERYRKLPGKKMNLEVPLR